MKRIGIAGMAMALSMGMFLAAPQTTYAEERSCRGTLGAITVDNLRVPQGASCRLEGTRIKGTIKVERNATLVAVGVRVVGNVQAEEAKRVVVSGYSRVNGSIQLDDGGSALIRRTTIGGSLQMKVNAGKLVAERNVIDADLQAFSNSGGVEITSNRIDGNLQCKSNDPRPTGGGNLVQGNKEDQCRRL